MDKINKKLDGFIDDANVVIEKYKPNGLIFLASFDRDEDKQKAAEAGIVRFESAEHLKSSLYELMLRNPMLKDAISMIIAESRVVTIGEPALKVISSEIHATPKKKATN